MSAFSTKQSRLCDLSLPLAKDLSGVLKKVNQTLGFHNYNSARKTRLCWDEENQRILEYMLQRIRNLPEAAGQKGETGGPVDQLTFLSEADSDTCLEYHLFLQPGKYNRIRD